MKILKYIFMMLLVVVGASSCGDDNYLEPKETFTGAIIDKETKEPFQTAIGNTGVRIRMMEYSWSETPEPYDMNCRMDGTFNNTKIFKGEYGINLQGAFVPVPEERIQIKGTVEKVYEVEPLLRIKWVGEPVMNADGTVDVKVIITRGTTNPQYQQALQEAWLFVSETNYVGDFSYSPNYSTKLTAANISLDTELTIRTGQPTGITSNPKPFPSYSRKFFLRFGARTNIQFGGTNRYNYTNVKEITTIAR